ncbi:hypothetical protein Asulf_01118 [Archaeoglobus sulfaticallidus PM70-1]|uniref:THUMP domain-containing protein n=1 Tax=Archaeoglobus sulfaticallidus PM70-1 TaxID=387631 RepID=N0BDN9_9EURY|nr:THUMP domain-containing protein [Archaeoglobus sulfaticallidus]AGK61118.1 hypothetical protein Asulf_01118 [Archaeoglobus sulfaticallidus PM70-1]
MIILRYDEIALKSSFVRRKFEKILMDNVRRVIRKEFGIKASVRGGYGRIYVDVGGNVESVARRISNVFGVVSAHVSVKRDLNLEKNAEEIAEYYKNRIKGSFAVRVKRSGKHDFTSMDASKIIGRKLKEITGARVDLKNPETEIRVEIRDSKLYLMTSTYEGFGGLPVGSQERVLCIISDEKSLLSTWYAMKRGCDVDVLYSERFEFIDNLPYWASYRRINTIQEKGGFEDLLSKAFSMDYKAVYCSITSKEIESYIDLLKNRKLPVLMPLLPFDDSEIDEKIKMIRMIGGSHES